jgi:hypothetical protein
MVIVEPPGPETANPRPTASHKPTVGDTPGTVFTLSCSTVWAARGAWHASHLGSRERRMSVGTVIEHFARASSDAGGGPSERGCTP